MFVQLAKVFDTNGNNCNNILILVDRHCFNIMNNFVPTFLNLYWHFPCWKDLAVTYIK